MLIEHILLQHPAVLDAGVVGRPSPVVEELPTALIVKQPGVNITEQELIDYVAKEVNFILDILEYHLEYNIQMISRQDFYLTSHYQII